ncbi:allophanate hydrolase [Thalassovita litoralis]|jgi:allophanate hydrolase|uniref:Allophanate hydrolase n=1 Tax=Thalassovita litoralis TaxID=1010611 RepID=A0A521FPZ3_9RHOB|nr:biotin-dependent carboxyltransferase family protein [Thalassovita litoralis]SMO98249.1 allophanate hydrolase [Thalassovita litoralis]
MTRTLTLRKAGPGLSVQDMGRPGNLVYGLSRGGAADPLALAEGAALLSQSPDLPAVEMAGMGGDFVADCDLRLALTGAEMRATLDGTPLVWNASHDWPKGAMLSIGAARTGSYGYLHVGGGIDVAEQLGARSAHLGAGLGRLLSEGECLPVGADPVKEVGRILTPEPRFGGGEVRVLPSLQTDLFPPDVLARFQDTDFHRDMRGNRMGVRMNSDGPGFLIDGGLTVLSEVIVPGDIQVTGDGAPFVLLAECQTTGGYPRIGTVLPCDLPKVAQAQPGAGVRFRFVTLDQAVEVETRARATAKGLRGKVQPLVRDPHDIPDLLSYQLISGAIAGNEEM